MPQIHFPTCLPSLPNGEYSQHPQNDHRSLIRYGHEGILGNYKPGQ